MTRAERQRLEGHIYSVRKNATQWESWGWTGCAATAWKIVERAEQRLREAHRDHA